MSRYGSNSRLSRSSRSSRSRFDSSRRERDRDYYYSSSSRRDRSYRRRRGSRSRSRSPRMRNNNISGNGSNSRRYGRNEGSGRDNNNSIPSDGQVMVMTSDGKVVKVPFAALQTVGLGKDRVNNTNNNNNNNGNDRERDRFRESRDRKDRERERDRNREGRDFDGEKPVSFKEFMVRISNDCSAEEAKAKYEAYMSRFSKKDDITFFDRHKDEEWFQERYDPIIIEQTIEERRAFARDSYLNFYQKFLNDEIAHIHDNVKEFARIEKELDQKLFEIVNDDPDFTYGMCFVCFFFRFFLVLFLFLFCLY